MNKEMSSYFRVKSSFGEVLNLDRGNKSAVLSYNILHSINKIILRYE